MNLDEILTEWDNDCQIDRVDVGASALQVPKLHAKYYRMFANARLVLTKLEQQYNELYRLKREYYNGVMDTRTMEDLGWEPFYLKILKSDVDKYIDADKEIIKTNLRIAMQGEKVAALESILKSIANRGYLLKTIVDWEKFRVGA